RLSARRIGGGVALGGTRGRDHPGRERPGGAQRGRRAQAVNRAVALFVGACVAALVIGHLLRDTPGYMARNPDGTITGDLTLYVLNPAALFDVAHWAQPDGAHSLFSVVAIGLLSLGQEIAPWAALGAAALAKPQAWAIVPLLAIATMRTHGLIGMARGIVAAS